MRACVCVWRGLGQVARIIESKRSGVLRMCACACVCARACWWRGQVARIIESKQLGPTVRTQYMRTAFQIPFDSSVRLAS